MKLFYRGSIAVSVLVITGLIMQCQKPDTNQQAGIKVGPNYSYSDRRDPSANPPVNLPAAKVPLLVAFGFDDNGFSGLDSSSSKGGLRFVLDLAKGKKNPPGKGNAKTFDQAPIKFSFYCAAQYIGASQNESPVYIRRAMREALIAGHEIGNHTYSHEHGTQFTLDRWDAEINECTRWMIKPYEPHEDIENPDIRRGIGHLAGNIFGFRTPFLEYNDTMFTAITNLGFLYDCSIEEGWQENQDGTNFLWPYTLDNGSPGNAKTTQDGVSPLIGKHPGLWELPLYPVIVPADSKCKEYGAEPGLRAKLSKVRDYIDTANGKITGLDWNLFVDFQMSKAEFLAAMKYTLDLRLAGNRCPFLFGCHSDIYAEAYPDSMPNVTPQERREALTEFLHYALSKPEVRIATMKEVLDWLRNPVALE